jgi:hypothetical protein
VRWRESSRAGEQRVLRESGGHRSGEIGLIDQVVADDSVVVVR